MKMSAPPLHLGQLLERQKDHFADSLAYQYLNDSGVPEKSITFHDLYLRAANQARVIHHHTNPGDRVLLMIHTQLEFMEAFFACALSATIPVPVYVPKSVEAGPEMTFIKQIAQNIDARLFITSAAQLDRIKTASSNQGFLKSQQTLTLESLANNSTPRSNTLPLVAERDTALILFTSGSTGTPKGVVLTHENLMVNFTAFSQTFGLSTRTSICTWLPNFHIAGLYTRLVGLLSGSPTLVFAPHAFLTNPAVWLQTLSDQRVHMSAAPNFAYQICANIPANAYQRSLDLSSWKMAISGGEVIQPTTLAAFENRYQAEGFHRESFLPYFGMTETLCTTIPQIQNKRQPCYFSRRAIEAHSVLPMTEECDDSVGLISNGQLLANTHAVIVNPETSQRASDSEIGELWLRGPSLTKGYWQQDDLNEHFCRAKLVPDDGELYFRTGDLGFFADQELFLTGRLKDLIIINGKNYYPTDIESTLKDVLSSNEALNVAAFPIALNSQERLAIAIESSIPANAPEWKVSLEQLKQTVRKHHGLSTGAIIILPPQSFPLTRSGKIRRSSCRQRVEDGTWPTWSCDSISTHDRSQAETQQVSSVIETLMTLFSPELDGTSNWNGETTLQALGIDSIAAVRLATHIYNEWQYQVDYATFFSEITLSELATQIEQHQQGGALPTTHSIEYQNELTEVDAILRHANQSPAQPGAIFLTGATGFLGGYLLRDLLRETEQPIICLIRAKSISTAKERLVATLENLGWNGIVPAKRLRPICGTLDQPRFGLTPNEFVCLSEQVTQIIHNGANVNFVAPYSTLHAVNVASNLDILRLATTGPQKRIHYISTIGVFNGPDRDKFNPIGEHNWIANPDQLFSGYSQSKWVAETLYRRAQEKGHPVRTYRPGLVMGDSRTGYCHTEDFVCRFIKGCIEMGQFPNLDLPLDMTPVDYVSRSIVHILSQPDLDGQAFHILNPQGIPIPSLAQWFQNYGYDVELTDSENWHRQLAEGLPESNALFPLAPFLLQRLSGSQQTILPFFAERGFNLDTSNLDRSLSGSSTQCPPVNHALLNCYTNYFRQIGFLPNPKLQTATAAATA